MWLSFSLAAPVKSLKTYAGLSLNEHQGAEGFTLVELVVVMAIMVILLAIPGVNIIRPQSTASVDGIAEILMTDLRQQQTKAMLGESDGGSPAPYGIYFDLTDKINERYVLFKNSYDPTNPANFEVKIDNKNNNIDVELLHPAGQTQILFDRQSGELGTNSVDSIQISDPATRITRIIDINQYGAFNVH